MKKADNDRILQERDILYREEFMKYQAEEIARVVLESIPKPKPWYINSSSLCPLIIGVSLPYIIDWLKSHTFL